MSTLLTLNTGNDGRPYDAFLQEKVAFDRTFGFDVDDADLSPIFQPDHPDFKPHQRDIVKWAVAGGRRAIFARYGLGKSVMQLEVLRLCTTHRRSGSVNGRGLLVAPLGVRFDIISDAKKHLGIEVRFVRSTDEVDLTWSGLYVTNYESVRAGKLDVNLFDAVSLDEAAILRSFGSETYQTFLPLFAGIRYRFVATATPSPNRHKELIHYAGFLGIMDTGQALTRFFKRDSSKANELHLYPHKRREFWLWLNTWACFLQRPSDLGHSDAGYAKWVEDDKLTETMSEVLREFGLSATAISSALTRSMGVEREEFSGDGWSIALNDSVIEWRDHVDRDSFGLIVTSIPFGGKCEYSPNYADFGHVDDNGQFWWQMDYLTPSLYNALMPGRILAVHVKDFPIPGSQTGRGVYTSDPMHAEAIAHYKSHGFDYYGMITVTTDVVRENNQTYRLSFSEMLLDHSKMGVGAPEYVLLFHKPQTDLGKGYADQPIAKVCAAHQPLLKRKVPRSQWGPCTTEQPCPAYSVGRWQIDAAGEWRTGGDRLLTGDELAALEVGIRSKLFTAQSERTVYDYDAHVALADRLAAKDALPGTFASLVPGSWRPDVWTDVLRIDTLNSEQRRREVEAHICPFPLDIPRRLITMFSNPGELVGDPFSGLGSTVIEAVKQDRRGFGSELNPVSVADSVIYLTRHDVAKATPTLFDLLDLEGSAA